MDNKFFESYRREFPVTEKYIYLDHAGVAPLPLRVKQAIEMFLTESSQAGAFLYPKWAARVAEIRRACARLINAGPDEVAFVKSTSHGLSIVAQGLDWKAGDKVLVYEKEFPSNLYTWRDLERRGVEIKTIPFGNGKILPEDIERLIDSKTKLLAISSVQFTNGFRIDLKRVGELCRRKNVLFCVDAIQGLGAVPMNVKDYHIDFLSADAHKWLLGPEGIGIFYCKKALAEKIHPPLIGWKSVLNEFSFDQPDFRLKTDALRFEEGTMNLMGVLGLGAALDLLFEAGIENIQERVLDLGDLIINQAVSRGHLLLTPAERNARGGIVTFTGFFHPVKVKEALLAKGIMVNVRGGGLRISPHFYNTNAEIERLFAALDEIIKQLQ